MWQLSNSFRGRPKLLTNERWEMAEAVDGKLGKPILPIVPVA